MQEVVKGVHVIGIRSKSQIPAEALAKADKLLTIGAFCIGTNQIEMNTATERGIGSAPRTVPKLVLENLAGRVSAG